MFLLPFAMAPLGLALLMALGIPFHPDASTMLASPLFLLISILTIIGFAINFGMVFPYAKKHRSALASALLWPANFIISGFSLAYFTWNLLPFHLFVLPMFAVSAYNYYSFFRKKQNP